MKNRQDEKTGGGEWSRRAHALLGHHTFVFKTAARKKTARPHRTIVQRVRDHFRDRVRDEWMKWAQVAFDPTVVSRSKDSASVLEASSSAKKPKRELWALSARNHLDRENPDTLSNGAEEEKAARGKARRLRERAREEWMKWAPIVVKQIGGVVSISTPKTPEGVALLLQPPSSDLVSDNITGREKPGREEWIHWAEVIVSRLTTCVRVYSKPPYVDVFMADKERQEKNARTLDLLKRIHTLTDEADTPTNSLTELEHHDERTIAGLKVLMIETLNRLPELSADMQSLLKSPWFENCNGRLADELFRGPLGGHEPEGIGSGQPEHGRLPESLKHLLEREESGEGRHPREALQGPQAHTPRWQDEAYDRWTKHNNHHVRTAGRVE